MEVTPHGQADSSGAHSEAHEAETGHADGIHSLFVGHDCMVHPGAPVAEATPPTTVTPSQQALKSNYNTPT